MTFTTDPALKMGALAAALATAFDAIPDVTVLAYDPIGFEINSPCICVGATRGGGTPIEQQGRQLGKDDQSEAWTVRLYHYLDDPSTDWASARALLGQMTAAIDIDFRLGGEVREARITEWSLDVYDASQTRRLLIGEVTVSVLYLMTNPT